MSIDLDKLIAKWDDFFDSEEGEQSIKEYVEKIRKEKEESTSYFETDDFFLKLNLLKNWMIQNGQFIVDGDDFYNAEYLQFEFPYPITCDEFYNVAGSIFTCLESYEKIDESNPFTNTYIEYNEWILRNINGQGTITRFELDISKLRDKNIETIIN